MDIIQKLKQKAQSSPKNVVFPEGEDETIIKAAAQIAGESIANPIILGDEKTITKMAGQAGLELKGVKLVDITAYPKLGTYLAEYSKIREMPEAVAKRQMKDPLYFGAMMVRLGDADAMVAGIANDTEDVIMACDAIIGLQKGISIPSSFFLMEIPGYQGPEGNILIFADAAVNANPAVGCLADIAITTARSARELLGWEPRVAMLSFSTKGSAVHPDVDKVIEATQIAKERAPDLAIDGELQVDTAIVPEVAKRKLKEKSPVAGKANILIFPDLDAANIAYKLVQRLTGAKSYGPPLQGFKKPVSDLSRGATVEDVVGTAIMVAVRAQAS